MTARFALYWAPAPGDPLGDAGNAWLGRDPELGIALPQPDLPGIAAITAAPRHYGFHATLRPPMRLATSWHDFLAAAQALAARTPPFDLAALRVDVISGFLALREVAPCPRLHALADDAVRATEPHRLPPAPAELAQRRRAGLSPSAEANLVRWGYPYVMEDWRFHMTLTRRLDAAEAALLRPAAEAHFAAALAAPRQVTEIAVFTEGPGDPPPPMLVACRLPLTGRGRSSAGRPPPCRSA